MNNSEGLNLKKVTTIEKSPVNINESESQDKQKNEVISSMVKAVADFNGDTSRIINIANEAGVNIGEHDLKELDELSKKTISAQEEFFDKILSPEQRESQKNIIEKGESERASTILNSIKEKSKNLVKNKSFQKLINHAPFLGDMIMVGKMIRGKEGDARLTPREYIFYTGTVISSALSFYYLSQGENMSAGVSFSISEGFSYADSAIGIMKDVSAKLKVDDSKLAGMLRALSRSFEKGKDALGRVSADVLNTLSVGFSPNYSFNYANNEGRTA